MFRRRDTQSLRALPHAYRKPQFRAGPPQPGGILRYCRPHPAVSTGSPSQPSRPGRHLPTAPRDPPGRSAPLTTSYRKKTGTLGGPSVCPGASCTNSFVPHCLSSSAVSALHWSLALLPGGLHVFADAGPASDHPKRKNSRSARCGLMVISRPTMSPQQVVAAPTRAWRRHGPAANGSACRRQ